MMCARHKHPNGSGIQSLPSKGLPHLVIWSHGPSKESSSQIPSHPFPQRIYEGVAHGGDDGIGERNELALILGVVVAGLKVSIDGCTIEQGDHCELGTTCSKHFPLPCS